MLHGSPLVSIPWETWVPQTCSPLVSIPWGPEFRRPVVILPKRLLGVVCVWQTRAFMVGFGVAVILAWAVEHSIVVTHSAWVSAAKAMPSGRGQAMSHFAQSSTCWHLEGLTAHPFALIHFPVECPLVVVLDLGAIVAFIFTLFPYFMSNRVFRSHLNSISWAIWHQENVAWCWVQPCFTFCNRLKCQASASDLCQFLISTLVLVPMTWSNKWSLIWGLETPRESM